MEKATITIDLADDVDRWQWRCPRGHTQWEAVNRHFWCAACARQSWGNTEPEFDELVNWRTRERVPRASIELLERDAAPIDA